MHVISDTLTSVSIISIYIVSKIPAGVDFADNYRKSYGDFAIGKDLRLKYFYVFFIIIGN